jgi:YVTN family beta-propeller protein
MISKAILVASTVFFLTGAALHAADRPLIVLSRIPLGHVAGRIDHLAIDLNRNRLFVAELGNNSVGVIDLASQKVVKRITGLREPQGIVYEPRADRVYIASAGDGTVRALAAETLSPIGEVKLGEDADNIRLGDSDRVFVGYGSGAIAVLQAGKNVADLPLDAHPESFQYDAEHGRLFINEPEAHAIGVIDDKTGQQRAKWGVRGLNATFPWRSMQRTTASLLPIATRQPWRFSTQRTETCSAGYQSAAMPMMCSSTQGGTRSMPVVATALSRL